MDYFLYAVLATQFILIVYIYLIHHCQKKITENEEQNKKDLVLMHDAVLQYCEELESKISATFDEAQTEFSRIKDQIASASIVDAGNFKDVLNISHSIQCKIQDIINNRMEIRSPTDQMETLKSAFKGPKKSVKENERS